MSVLNPFEPGPAAGIALVATRLGGLMLVAPVFSARTVPAGVRAALMVALTAAFAPVVLAGGPFPAVGPGTLMSELLIGFALGMGAAVFVGGAEVAGDVLALQTGLSGAGSLDPLTSQQSQTMGDFMKLVVITLVLAMNGHLLMLQALADSTTLLPPGSPIELQQGTMAMVHLGSALFAMGLKLASPVIAAVFVGNIAMGVLARTAPQLQVFMLAYPLQIVMGLGVLALSLPLLGVSVSGFPGYYQTVVRDLLGALGAR